MDGRRVGLVVAVIGAAAIAVVAFWWRTSHAPTGGEETNVPSAGHDPARAGSPSARTGSDQGSPHGVGDSTAEILQLPPDGGPPQAGWIPPRFGGGIDPDALPLTGAALTAAWMPSLSPDDPAWDPRVEARQRFSSLELEAATLQTDDPETFSKLIRDHADDVEAMTSRALDLRGAGHDERARHLEDEWARLEEQLVLDFAPQ